MYRYRPPIVPASTDGKAAEAKWVYSGRAERRAAAQAGQQPEPEAPVCRQLWLRLAPKAAPTQMLAEAKRKPAARLTRTAWGQG